MLSQPWIFFFSLSVGELGSILKIIALALSVNKYMHSNLFLSLFPSLLLFVYFSTFSTVPTMIHIPNVFASLQLGSSVVLLFRWAKWMQHKLNGADGLKWHKTNKKNGEKNQILWSLKELFTLICIQRRWAPGFSFSFFAAFCLSHFHYQRSLSSDLKWWFGFPPPFFGCFLVN